MNRILKYLMAVVVLSAALTSCSDDEPGTVVPEPTQDDKGYCLMFYASGGDHEHDLLFMSTINQAAKATADCQDVAMTCLFKQSSPGDSEDFKSVRRYTGENGELVQDNTFDPAASFAITDPANLTDFIRWSAKKFPDRKYIFVFCGHGLSFTPTYDLPESRASLWDDGNMMASDRLAKGLRDSGLHFEAMIAESCQQGSLEMLAEWEGLADYLLGSPFSIPDLSYDYPSLLSDLSEGKSMEETLVQTARRSMNIWQEMDDREIVGTVVEVTRMSDLSALWNALHETFTYMSSSFDGVNYTTDPPSVPGETYREGYRRALRAMYSHDEEDFFESLRAQHAVDIADFLRNAVIYSGNDNLITYVNRVDKALENVIALHLQSNGKHDYIYNVYVGMDMGDAEVLERYRSCRFDRLTGWGTLCAALLKPSDRWIAGTIVDPREIELSGSWDYWFKAEEISDEVFNRMWLKSWKADCPLNRSDLRYLKVLHHNADGKFQRGEMVVNAAIATKVKLIFWQLFMVGYKIERMELVDNYDADDEASMRANNSSSFNFRFMTGSTTKISKHGLGLAIDINTLYNPYVKQQEDGTWHIEPATGEPYAFDRENRTDIPYKIDHNDLAYKLFTKAGFEWGGDWTSLKDYQHFEIDL